ncbi:U1 small nuclear ribonucleoprotein C-like [Narcine bancroftii]|uniref:U1 small nuclear ribonucleoprotein C-like n=1 Tax=Narcine bancroftii TaxID=1343680 RepID=UPI003831293B
MPKYRCDYCDTYLTHDSPSVRKMHCEGRKHKENVKVYYQKWMEEQDQNLTDKTTASFCQGKIPPTAPFPVPPGMMLVGLGMRPPIGVPVPMMPGPTMGPHRPMMVPSINTD